MNGTQGNAWKQMNVTLPDYKTLSVVFEGVVGDDYMGDIALDDISMVDGPCLGDSGTSISIQLFTVYQLNRYGHCILVNRYPAVHV